MRRHLYLIALGSNRCHHRHGSPRGVLRAAIKALDRGGLAVFAASRVIETAPLGPSRRHYANAVAVVFTNQEPERVLENLQHIERKFGRRQGGQRWGQRVLDLDIVLWGGGSWKSPGLVIPHPRFRERRFVLDPALPIAGEWRDPITGLTVRHLAARLTKPRHAPR